MDNIVTVISMNCKKSSNKHKGSTHGAKGENRASCWMPMYVMVVLQLKAGYIIKHDWLSFHILLKNQGCIMTAKAK